MTDDSLQKNSLNDQMRCGLLASPNGDIMIVHDKKIPTSLEWVEYNKNERKLFLIDDEGSLTDLGIVIDEAMSENLTHGTEITLVQLNDSKITHSQKTSIVIQDY